jgi:hypothetical protein
MAKQGKLKIIPWGDSGKSAEHDGLQYDRRSSLWMPASCSREHMLGMTTLPTMHVPRKGDQVMDLHHTGTKIASSSRTWSMTSPHRHALPSPGLIESSSRAGA